MIFQLSHQVMDKDFTLMHVMLVQTTLLISISVLDERDVLQLPENQRTLESVIRISRLLRSTVE
ncbi:MAG: hypothetical protein AAFO69_12050 [Bacteroidota bacterium]